jgi:hypothetical protein
MHDAMTDRDRLEFLRLAQPSRAGLQCRRDIFDLFDGKRSIDQRFLVSRLGTQPGPRSNPVDLSFDQPANTWNLTLEDPALTTRIVSITGHAAGSAALARRAWA